jgi:hypothetical protein
LQPVHLLRDTARVNEGGLAHLGQRRAVLGPVEQSEPAQLRFEEDLELIESRQLAIWIE